MARSGRTLAVMGGVVAFLLAAGCSAGPAATSNPGADAPAAQAAAANAGPTVADTTGTAMAPGHAEVVREVHGALVAGDLEALRGLYTGNDWAGQQELLAKPEVRDEVLAVLGTHAANLGEGYVYPGFTVAGWTGPLDRVDAATLDLSPETLPEPTLDYAGYQTAFFLAEADGGPLQWRGIDRLPSAPAAATTI